MSQKAPRTNASKSLSELLKHPEWNDKQKELLRLINLKDCNCIIIKGPAGTSKTILSVFAGLTFLKKKYIDKILYIRTPVESGDSRMGYLPGTVEDKLRMYSIPFYDKIVELTGEDTLKALKQEGKIDIQPVNYLRGQHWERVFVIGDEMQSATIKELLTLMSRIGPGSKIILLGDPDQNDLQSHKVSGFLDVYNLFQDDESQKKGIYTFEFTEEDIVRSEFVKYIIKKFHTLKKRAG